MANAASGTQADSTFPHPLFTFGEVLIESNVGSMRLYGDGRPSIQQLGEAERGHYYWRSKRNFRGDRVFSRQIHFVQCLTSGTPFETSGEEYLKPLAVNEAVYQAAESGLPGRGMEGYRP